jgi:peptidoglycan hydrolase FlgJ
MITALSNAISGSGISSGMGSLADSAKAKETERKFASLVDGMKAGSDLAAEVSSKSIKNDPRLPGDYISSFAIGNPNAADRAAPVTGAAANAGQKGKIDKTSKLYEQALELESYFVKIMLSSMRETVTKTNLGGDNDFAGKMYDDMYYDELSRNVTQKAGFGLADQVYLQLSGTNKA